VTAATSKVPRSKTQVNSAPFENPLIPNKRLCAVYTAMAELRLLDAFVASRANAKKPKVQLQASLGLEACRVSTALNLEPGDLTSESAPSIATRFLRGAKLAELIAQVEAFHTGPRKAAAAFSSASELPLLAPGKERIYLALGAAQTLKAAPSGKTAKLSRILVAYVNPTELNTSEWTEALHFASIHALPILFVAFPDASVSAAKIGRLSRNATAAGVPGILVDSADPVALYRVMQESLERMRHNGGPVLMECIEFRPTPRQPVADPIATMAAFLLGRKVVTEDWMRSVEQKFRKRLETASQ